MALDITNDDPPSKTPETIELYRQIFERLKRFTIDDLHTRLQTLPQGEDPPASTLVITFRERESTWSKATAKLYRVALEFTLRNMGTIEAYEARKLLNRDFMDAFNDDEDRAKAEDEARDHDAAVLEVRKQRSADVAAGKERPRTSGQKAKQMSSKDMATLLSQLVNSSSQFGPAAQLWLMAGYLTGLRPGEWATAKLDRDEKGRKVLIVNNGKYSNGRSFGFDRKLILERLTDIEYAVVEQHVMRANRENDSGTFDKYYDGCRYYLHAVTSRLWPKQKTRPTLYTSRHMFAADAKSVFSKIHVAALMGHGSDKTAGLHYTKKRYAKGGAKIDPSDIDVSAVAKMNPITKTGFDRSGKGRFN